MGHAATAGVSTTTRHARQNVPRDVLRRNLESQISELSWKVAPPTSAQALAELTRCLALAVPAGMTEPAREAWLRVAVAEVGGIPAAYFAEACQHARRTADHPAKIIPAICRYRPTFDPVPSFREQLEVARRRLANLDARRLQHVSASSDDDPPMSLDELREIAPSMRATAVARGWALQEDLDALNAERGEDEDEDEAPERRTA